MSSRPRASKTASAASTPSGWDAFDHLCGDSGVGA
jgi:hypothetical protein